MDIIELLTTRRSIRKYTAKEIREEIVEELLRAAMYAPSAGNQQPWHFVVLRNKAMFRKINEFHPYSAMLQEANLAILVCADTTIETKRGYWPLDCSAATENILIAAHGLGLGAVWLGIYPRPDRQDGMKKLLRLPDNISPFSLVSIGYPAEQKALPNRFVPERIHYEKW
jgi:nitroreductase